HRAREVADAADVGRTLSDGDGAARVEKVERMRGLQHLVVRRQRDPTLDQLLALGLVLAEPASEDVDRRGLEVVDRPLTLSLAVDVAPGDAICPLQLEGGSLLLDEEGEPFEPVRDLRREEVELEQ